MAGPAPGTPRKQKAASLAAALRAILTPDAAAAYWLEAWEMARAHKAPRSMIEVLQVGLNYAYGKPRETLRLESDATDLLARIMQDAGPLLPPRRDAAVTIDGHALLPDAEPDAGATSPASSSPQPDAEPDAEPDAAGEHDGADNF